MSRAEAEVVEVAERYGVRVEGGCIRIGAYRISGSIDFSDAGFDAQLAAYVEIEGDIGFAADRMAADYSMAREVAQEIGGRFA